MQEVLEFNDNWKFHFGDIVSVRNRWAWAKSGSFNQGPESRDYDDSDWKNVTLPHDFVFETKPYGYSEKEFDKDNAIPEMEDVNNIHTTAGSFDKNAGWYRKHFFLPKEYEGKKLYLIFDGIYRDSTFFLNEFFLEREPDGYTRIVVDITDTAVYGGDNILSVRCDAREAQGWFYEGGGIYREAYLKVVEKEHLEELFVYAQLSDDHEKAQVNVSGKVYGTDEFNLLFEIKDSLGKTVKRAGDEECDYTYLHEEGCHFFKTKITMEKPELWSVDAPQLYEFVCSLKTDEVKNEVKSAFGVRSAVFDNEKGFLLNGTQLKIKGVCCHQNHGGLGNAVPKEVMRFRIKKLKEMGANGYRGAHYPLTESFLDVCDQEGMLVMLETRLLSSAKPDMCELERMVKLGRNHPSVIIYSIGNEEAQSQATVQGARIVGTMMDYVKRLDPYRPVTMALLMLDMKTNTLILDYKVLEDISKQLDVAGYNYHSDLYEKFHQEYPWQPFICTEQGTFKSTRGCYRTDNEKCHLAINERRPYYMLGAQRWRDCMPDWVSGLFIWTGFDYYGEPTPFAWPAISSQFGAMDLCGNPKDFYYFYKAWWTNEDVIHVYPDMNQEPGQELDYYVFSNAEEVELILNGVSLGKKKMPKDDYLVWEKVVSQKGSMEIVGYRDGAIVMRSANETADASSARIQVDEEFREDDIVIRKISLVDKNGNIVPNADVRFDIPAEWGLLLGASNGNPTDHTAGKAGFVYTFHGLAQVITKEMRDVEKP